MTYFAAHVTDNMPGMDKAKRANLAMSRQIHPSTEEGHESRWHEMFIVSRNGFLASFGADSPELSRR